MPRAFAASTSSEEGLHNDMHPLEVDGHDLLDELLHQKMPGTFGRAVHQSLGDLSLHVTHLGSGDDTYPEVLLVLLVLWCTW